eukprot:scaffold21543_cov30-Tisochrysis_lutea.AAC.3
MGPHALCPFPIPLAVLASSHVATIDTCEWNKQTLELVAALGYNSLGDKQVLGIASVLREDDGHATVWFQRKSKVM